ncbi:MAG: class I SAM-dependent methyltransferase [Galactobacter sp.]
MPSERVKTAYGARADEYIEAVGRIEHAAAADLTLIRAWALGCSGPLLDVGCGPGQWTHWLHDQGAEITGVDPVPEFIERARAAYPDASYRLGRADHLGVEVGSLGGLLAWYSLIHTDAPGLESALAEFARCVRPGGGLLLGFFAGSALEPFEHAITPAYYWPVSLLAAQVAAAGFHVVHTAPRTDPGARMHGEIIAVRSVDD